MNILFLTIGRFESIEVNSMYSDLLRLFRNHGHDIYTITLNEKNTETEIINEKCAYTLHISAKSVKGECNLINKGIAQLLLSSTYVDAIKQHFSNVKFSLIIYSTPPVTLLKAVEYVKKRDNATTYLLLKDIFPQNAVDLNLLSTTGLRGFIYRYFRRQEKKLYQISDHIGCMSQANVDYILKHNPEIDPKKVEICPNSTDPIDMSCSPEERIKIRQQYAIPLDKKVFVYGGNLGKPQGIPFLIDCLRACRNIKDVLFLIIGSGTERHLIEDYVRKEQPRHIKLMERLPKTDYDTMIASCDVGLIFLDHRFTIPNFPSRLLSYMQAKLPILACTDPVTDIGKTIVEGGFGWWCESNKAENFVKVIKEILTVPDLNLLGQASYDYLKKNYSVNKTYNIIQHKIGE